MPINLARVREAGRHENPSALPDFVDPVMFQAELDQAIAVDPVVARIEARIKARVTKSLETEASIDKAHTDIKVIREEITALRKRENAVRIDILTLAARRQRLKRIGSDHQRRESRCAKLNRELAKKYWKEARAKFGKDWKAHYKKPTYIPNQADEINPYPKQPGNGNEKPNT